MLRLSMSIMQMSTGISGDPGIFPYMKRIFSGMVLVVCMAFVPSVQVGAEVFSPDMTDEHIRTYEVTADIRAGGAIDLTERIEYVFDTPRHGILRTIPYTKTNTDGKKYRLKLENIQVSDDEGDSYRVSKSWSGDMLTLKIGDPDRTVTGTHWYVISYTVSGGITYFSDHDELYWNMVGTEWDVPVRFARAVVTLPGTVSAADIRSACYTGISGSATGECTATNAESAIAVQTTMPLGRYEGLTAVVGFPKGVVAVVEPEELVSFFDTFWGKVVLAVIAVIAVLWYAALPLIVVRKWWTGGRDPKPAIGEVAAWFEPPQTKTKRQLTPAETGAIIDERVDLRDMYASIVDLARRGYMRIHELKKGEFNLVKTKDYAKDPHILPFEETLLSGIFATGDSVRLKSLNLTGTMESVKRLLYERVVHEGYFPKNPQMIRTLYGVLAGVAAVTFNPVLLLVSLVFGLNMPRKTLFGSEQAAVARSLKNFLSSQDKQLAFQAKNQMMFEKLLPYAVAFGVEKIWAERFADIALKQPDWYVSSSGGRFNAPLFVNSLSRGYSSSFSSATTTRSSSGFSSGFSGGGSSGGGGGGGGGGSW